MFDIVHREEYLLVSQAAENIYHNPIRLYPYEDVVNGVRVGKNLKRN
jgi:hypothetical protein